MEFSLLIILLLHYFIISFLTVCTTEYVSMDTYSEASGFRETCMTAELSFGWTDGKIDFESICNLTVSENVVW